jgi:putative phage-type endonuclease
MTAKVVLHKASRDVWLKHRRRGITATDLPALLNLNPSRTPLDVWLDKTQPGDDAPLTDWRITRGYILEGPIAQQWAHTMGGVWLEKPPLLLRHPTAPLLASLDYLAHTRDDTLVIDCKATNRWAEWQDGGCPDMYAVQVLTQLVVTGLPEGRLVADVAGNLETRVIYADPEWEAAILPWVRRWWQRHIIDLTPPDPDPVRDYPNLNRVWAPSPGETLEAGPDLLTLIRAWPDHQAARKAADTARGRIRIGMGTATRLIHNGATVASIDTRGALRITPPKEN